MNDYGEYIFAGSRDLVLDYGYIIVFLGYRSHWNNMGQLLLMRHQPKMLEMLQLMMMTTTILTCLDLMMKKQYVVPLLGSHTHNFKPKHNCNVWMMICSY